MKGKKAKELRRTIYGDLSLRATRQYKKQVREKNKTRINTGAILNTGPRAAYLLAKRLSNRNMYLVVKNGIAQLY